HLRGARGIDQRELRARVDAARAAGDRAGLRRGRPDGDRRQGGRHGGRPPDLHAVGLAKPERGALDVEGAAHRRAARDRAAGGRPALREPGAELPDDPRVHRSAAAVQGALARRGRVGLGASLRRGVRTQMRAIWACAALPLALACAGGGSSQPGKVTVLMTDTDEARAGREGAAEVAAQMGLLGDAALDAYVGGIGQKLLRGLPYRAFDYQFRVVDQVEPNAFALPGGYIFVSRGLLLLANDEDELACVIGHEITHVARHHAAAQQG